VCAPFPEGCCLSRALYRCPACPIDSSAASGAGSSRFGPGHRIAPGPNQLEARVGDVEQPVWHRQSSAAHQRHLSSSPHSSVPEDERGEALVCPASATWRRRPPRRAPAKKWERSSHDCLSLSHFSVQCFATGAAQGSWNEIRPRDDEQNIEVSVMHYVKIPFFRQICWVTVWRFD
jgi:hypothetical protein